MKRSCAHLHIFAHRASIARTRAAMSPVDDIRTIIDDVVRASTRSEAIEALERARRRVPLREISREDSSSDACSTSSSDVGDLCACVLRDARRRWYESLTASDRTRLVDSWFDAKCLRGAALVGAVQACASALDTASMGPSAEGRQRDDDHVVTSALTYYVNLVRANAVRDMIRWQARGREEEAVRQTLVSVMSAFSRLGSRFKVPIYRTTAEYDAEIARQALEAALEAPERAAEMLTRMCRRGAADQVASQSLSLLAERIRELDADTVMGIIADGRIPDSLSWATRMMSSAKDTHGASRWIEALFVECGKAERAVQYSWRTLDLVMRVLLRDRYWDCEVTRIALCETLLLRKGVPRAVLPALLRLTIIKPPWRANDDGDGKRMRDANIMALLEAWSTPDFVRGASSELQRHATASVCTVMSTLANKEWETMRGNPTKLILKGVQARLDSPLVRHRRHAHRVGLALSLKLDQSKPFRLMEGEDAESSADEEDWENDVQDLVKDAVTVEEVHEVLEGGVVAEEPKLSAEFVITQVEDPDEVVDVWAARRRVSDDEESDSDDDDTSDEELVPYDMDSDDDLSLRQGDPASVTAARLASLPKPRTLKACISALRQVRSGDASTRKTDIDLADAAEGAAHAVAEMVSYQPDELASCAADLAIAVLHAQPPTPDTDPLNRARREGLASVLTVAPGLAGPPTIEHALSDKCDASLVMDTLSSLDDAMRELASSSASSKRLNGSENNADASTQSVQKIGQERIFAPKSMEKRATGEKSVATRSHLIGECFVAPLLRAAAQRLERQSAPDYTMDGLDATVMGQILYTLGQSATYARNAVDGPIICRSILEFASAPALADSEHPHLRRSVLVAGALVATSLQEIATAVSYADNSALATALEKFIERAAYKHRSDADEDVRVAASYALAAAADSKTRALEAFERLANLELDRRHESGSIETEIPKLSGFGAAL